MDSIFSKQHHRRAFFSVIALVLALALISRFFILPRFEPTQVLSLPALIASLLDNLVISLFLAVAIAVFLFWLTPSIMKRSAIEVIEPKQINPLLKSVTSTSRSWVYKGACGRYTRATTLPKLAEAARIEGIGRDITICILNPSNEPLCAAYATYRRSLKSADHGVPWTQQVVQEEILATAVTALKFRFTTPSLRISLFLVDHFSAFRLDIADQFVVVTKEDKEAAAIRADAGTYFYDSYKDDVRLTERQSNEIPYDEKLTFADQMDESELRHVMQSSGIFDAQKLAGLDIARLIKSVNAPRDPY
jgi:hypothetical protein